MSKENKTLKANKEASDKKEAERAVAEAAERKIKDARVKDLEKQVKDLEALTKQAKENKGLTERCIQELSEVKGVLSRLPCGKDCTILNCPLNHGGLTNQQEAALQKAKKEKDDLREAKAQKALAVKAKEQQAAEEARAARIEKLYQQIEDEKAKGIGAKPTSSVGDRNAGASINDPSTNSLARNVETVARVDAEDESTGAGSKGEKDATSKTTQPVKKKAEKPTAENERLVKEDTESILAELETEKDTESEAGASTRTSPGRVPWKRGPAPTSLPTLPLEEATGGAAEAERTEPTGTGGAEPESGKGSSVLMHISGQGC
jgi:hypothetical protein